MKRIAQFFATLLWSLGAKAAEWVEADMHRRGAILAMDGGFATFVPTAEDFARGRVTNPEQSEITRGRLYDWLLYPAAGSQQLNFFALPKGQGITTALGATVGAAKTAHDTNLQVANTLPSGKAFFVESIEAYFVPGRSAGANTFLPYTPNFVDAAAAAATEAAAFDYQTWSNSGLLQLSALDKIYTEETPLNCFPPQVGISYSAAVAGTFAAGTLAGAQIVQGAGRLYTLGIPFTLMPAQNFSVQVTWPAVVAMPSTFNGRMGIILNGWFMRATQ